MCQAYEGERNFMIYMEERATIAGFKAAKLSQPIDSNPKTFQSERERWEHGYGCYQEGIIPWAIEQEYHRIPGKSLADKQNIRKRFEETKELPLELERLVA